MSEEEIYDCFHCCMTINSDESLSKMLFCNHRFHKLCAHDLEILLLRTTKICANYHCLGNDPHNRLRSLKAEHCVKLESSDIIKLEMALSNNIINHRAERRIIEERKERTDQRKDANENQKANALKSANQPNNLHNTSDSLNKLMTLVEANSKSTSELIESTKNLMQKINQLQDGSEETKTRLDRFEVHPVHSVKLEHSELLNLVMDVRNNIINRQRQINNSKIEERKQDKAILLNSTGTDQRKDAYEDQKANALNSAKQPNNLENNSDSLNKLMNLVEVSSKHTSELIEITKNVMHKINQPQDGLEDTKTRLDRFEKYMQNFDTRMAETLSHLDRIKIFEENLTLKIHDIIT